MPKKPPAAQKPKAEPRPPRDEPIESISVVGMPPHLNDNVVQRINHLRRKMLVHSFLYYRLATSVVTDASWDKWAKELKKLQPEWPEESKFVPYYEEFKYWDATTGFDLPLADPWVERAALRLLATHEEMTKKGGKSKTAGKDS